MNEYITNIRNNGMSNYDLAPNETPFDPSTITCTEQSSDNSKPSAEEKIGGTSTTPMADALDNSEVVENKMITNLPKAEEAKQEQNTGLIKSSKLENVFLNPFALKNTDWLKQSCSYTTPDEKKRGPPPKKKLKLVEESIQKSSDGDKIDKGWYDSMENSIGGLTNKIMLQMKQHNAKSLKYIVQLEQGLNHMKEENRLLKEENRLLKESEIKIQQLEEENSNLWKNAKTCMGCGKMVNTVLYCNANCEEEHFQ